MPDLVTQLREPTTTLRVGSFLLRVEGQGVFGPQRRLGIVLNAYAPGGSTGPEDYLNELLLAPEFREETYRVVDTWGLLVCKSVRSSHPSYRDVRGRSSRGRLSQGEYFHHDGCSEPSNPRVVEIRMPHQEVGRQVATAIAPFPATVYAMLRHGSELLRPDAEITPWRERLGAHGKLPADKLELVQGLVTRAVRRELAAEDARDFFREVDKLACAYCEPWEMGESRLICNTHPKTGQLGTVQHRRAYQVEHTGGVANGKLVKRWPAEELG